MKKLSREKKVHTKNFFFVKIYYNHTNVSGGYEVFQVEMIRNERQASFILFGAHQVFEDFFTCGGTTLLMFR